MKILSILFIVTSAFLSTSCSTQRTEALQNSLDRQESRSQGRSERAGMRDDSHNRRVENYFDSV